MKPVTQLLATVALLLLGTVLSLAMGAPVVAGALAFGTFARLAGPMAMVEPGSFMLLTDILWEDGSDNMGGLRTEAFYCFHSEVQNHAAPNAPGTATALSQLVTCTDHTFKQGKGWKKIYTTEDTGMVESTLQGEKDGKSFINKIKLHFPGAGLDIMGLIRYGINAGWYAIGVDAEGRRRLVGSQYWPAKLDTSTITTTETAAGLKGVTFELVASCPYPAPVLTGPLQLQPEDSGS